MTPGIQELMRQVEKVVDGYVDAVFAARDVEAALALTAEQVSVVEMPALTGARDRDALRRHLAEVLVPHLPADLTRRRISRTTDRFRVVDETVVAFTHDRELPWLLPGAAPTHRRAEALAISVATVRQGRIVSLRTLWDQVALLTGLGLEPGAVRAGAAATVAAEGPSSWW